MARYIDAEEVRRYLIEQCFFPSVHIESSLEKLPMADVVEVVRCKDCNRSRSMSFDGYCYCKRNKVVRKHEDFCSRAKKKGV